MRRALAAVAVLLAVAGGAQAAPTDDASEPGLEEKLPAEAAGAAGAVASTTTEAASSAGSAASALAAGLEATAEALAAGAALAGSAAAGAWTLLAEAASSAASAASAALVAAADAVAAAAIGAWSGAALAARGVADAASVAASMVAAGAVGAAQAGLALAGWALERVLSGLGSLASSAPARGGPAARGAVGGAAGAAAWSGYRAALRRGILAPLYSRIPRDELLDHDVRRAIYDHVSEHPGAHVSEIADAVDVGWGTAVYHLERLSSAEILVSETHGNHRCFFRNGEGVSEEAREAIPALKNDKARDVVEFVRENPAASQQEVAEALDMSAALVSWHVSRLADSGLLEKEREGRGNALYVDDETAGPALRAAA